MADFVHHETGLPADVCQVCIAEIVGGMPTSSLYQSRLGLSQQVAVCLRLSPKVRDGMVDVIRNACKCYAGLLGTMRAGHPGYADQFESPELFPGRMTAAANWGFPTTAEHADKPWLIGLPRLIFISDMGDALSGSVPFEYLEKEIIRNVDSEAGQKHIWLWLTKRPERMAHFGEWLLEHGGRWPINLVAMTTVTSQRFASRVDALRRVPAAIKGLSLEPLLERVSLDLTGINWVIAGGGSDTLAETFHVPWALELEQQCRDRGVAFFLKQLGRNPYFNGPLKLQDPHGGDSSEWPDDWRIRQTPEAFLRVSVHLTPNPNNATN